MTRIAPINDVTPKKRAPLTEPLRDTALADPGGHPPGPIDLNLSGAAATPTTARRLFRTTLFWAGELLGALSLFVILFVLLFFGGFA